MAQYSIRKFRKVMVANRGEIAIRIFRALNELGITTVAIFSKEDKYALFRTKADESYELNPEKGPIDAYLDIKQIIKIAKAKNVDAIHPGYGFLSENPEFVEACEKNGITFIGPSKELMERMGDKISSKQMAIECDVPIIPGVDYALKSEKAVLDAAHKIGYPVMLKASSGGGGRGMRIVRDEEQLIKEYREAREESKKAFGDDKIFLEKYLEKPKHIEVQILADNYGNVVHLFDRDCSVQRRHQKVVEYAPVKALFDHPLHPYTEGLIQAIPRLGHPTRRLDAIEGMVPDAGDMPQGCHFHPRCKYATERCRQEHPALVERPDGRCVRCFRAEEEA